ncbi:hypothetical protein WJX73_002775 [Symbiochloris irregularis]|uniref:B3 domain-containing protein n=1 Tax=Symbiochloris irregularis TaxID=706552 RepID=A0AAW1PMI7_9CHLO
MAARQKGSKLPKLSVAVPETRNPYELKREEQIARNKKRLAELQIDKAAAELIKACCPEPAAPRPRKVRKEGAPVNREPVRRSSRTANANAEKPVYFEAEEVDHEAKDRMRDEKTISRWVAGRNLKEYHQGVHYHLCSEKAILAAQHEAFSLAEAIGGCAKAMWFSMVHSGFWMEAPAGMAATFPNGRREQYFRLVCQNAQCKVCASEKDGAWQVNWLPRGLEGKGAKRSKAKQVKRNVNGAGLSGGWAGFAKKHNITQNDTMCFKMHQPSHGMENMTGHIFRACDHEDEQVSTSALSKDD